ncbi:MAG: HYR domain-containing protein [Phycisphaerae bacterium]
MFERRGCVAMALCVALALGASTAPGQVVYQNNDLGTRGLDHGFGLQEGGDQITLSGPCRDITQLELAIVVGALAPVDLVVRIYANDGPVSPNAADANEPGTPLFQSGVITVQAFDPLGFNIFTVPVPNVTVPDTFTWTIERVDGVFLSLPRFGPPSIGSSSDFIWTHFPPDWSPSSQAVVSNSFYAVVTAAGGATTITCPADAVVECGGDTSPMTTGQATATACGAVTVSSSDSSLAACGATQTITRTWTADDGAGNTATCGQTITTQDTTAPGLTVPPDAVVECDASTDPAETGQAAASDACDLAPTITFTDAFTAGPTCSQAGVTTRTWRAIDACGNMTAGDQSLSIVDTTPPVVSCPATISTSGGFGGTVVIFTPGATDACDPNPAVTSTPPSGSFFTTGVTSVAATASDACTNSATCGFDVLVSCFGVNRAKIGTKDTSCRGIEEIELTSFDGTEELVSLFKAEEGEGGGIEEDVLPPSIVVNDGVNGPVTIDTSCVSPIAIGDVFGAYTVTDLKEDYDDSPEDRGNEVEVRGSFDPAVPFDLALDDVTLTLADAIGNSSSITIPAGSFQVDGKPEKKKFKFEGLISGVEVEAKFKSCKFKIEAEGIVDTSLLTGTAITVGLQVGPNLGQETVTMEDKGNHLKFKRKPKIECCPKCEGVASMQVTSDQGVLVFEPSAGQTELAANTLVDDGVNGPVTIHTSCSKPIDVGDVHGAYTISEVVKNFDLPE